MQYFDLPIIDDPETEWRRRQLARMNALPAIAPGTRDMMYRSGRDDVNVSPEMLMPPLSPVGDEYAQPQPNLPPITPDLGSPMAPPEDTPPPVDNVVAEQRINMPADDDLDVVVSDNPPSRGLTIAPNSELVASDGLRLPGYSSPIKDFETQKEMPIIGATDTPKLWHVNEKGDIRKLKPGEVVTDGESYATRLDALRAVDADNSIFKDKKWSKWDKIAAALEGWAKGGIFNAISAVRDPHYFERQRMERKRADILPQIAMEEHKLDTDAKRRGLEARTKTIATDDARQRDQLTRLQAKDATDAQHKVRANLLRQLNDLPEFDPTDPENADMVNALRAAGLPVIAKSAKAKFKYITNARTGEVFVDRTDEAGHRKLEQVTEDDGTPFKADTPQMMTAADKAEQRALQKQLADQGNVTRIKVAEINAGSRKEIAQINQGGATDRSSQTQATHAAQVLAAIEVNAPKGSTPDQIKAKKDAYRNSLPAAVKALVPE